MQINYKDQIITIPSMNSDEQNQIEFILQQSCGTLTELQIEYLTPKQKKELIKFAEDKDGGIENGIEAITQIRDTINTFELIQEILINKLQQKLSRVAKKLSTFETYQQNETKRNELENEIIETNSIDIPNLNDEEINQLEEWTGLKCSDVIFDSEKDNWNQNTSVLNEKILGKSKVVFIVEDTDGDIFGYYFNTQIIEKYHDWIQTDYKSFEFSLKSRNNRLQKRMKFEIKDLNCGGIYLWRNTDNDLIRIGNIQMIKQHSNRSNCLYYTDRFEYNEIENPLSSNDYFETKRLVVVQME